MPVCFSTRSNAISNILTTVFEFMINLETLDLSELPSVDLMKNKPSSVNLEIIRKLESVLNVKFDVEFSDVV
jgi:hypothetical protein